MNPKKVIKYGDLKAILTEYTCPYTRETKYKYEVYWSCIFWTEKELIADLFAFETGKRFRIYQSKYLVQVLRLYDEVVYYNNQKSTK